VVLAVMSTTVGRASGATSASATGVSSGTICEPVCDVVDRASATQVLSECPGSQHIGLVERAVAVDIEQAGRRQFGNLVLGDRYASREGRDVDLCGSPVVAACAHRASWENERRPRPPRSLSKDSSSKAIWSRSR
jgi:hypothetical protein